MITVGFWGMAGLLGLASAAGCLLGMICAWHPGHDSSDRGATSGVPARPGRPGNLPVAGYLPTDNAGCYQPRTGWPEPDWPDSTFSEISAGWDRLERNVAAQTQPFGRIRP